MGNTAYIKIAVWNLLGLSVTGFVFWMLANPSFPDSQLIFGVIFTVITIVSSIGTFWMAYMAIRCERNPWPILVLIFLPFSFLWYYQDRVRSGKNVGRNLSVV